MPNLRNAMNHQALMLALLIACSSTPPAPAPVPAAGDACTSEGQQLCGVASNAPAALKCNALIWREIVTCDTGQTCVESGTGVACLVAPVPACGKIASPTLSAFIDGGKALPATCAHFAPDWTNGIEKQTKAVILTNSGASRTLCLYDVRFTATASALMHFDVGVQNLDARACPGALASLDPGKSLVTKVTYALSPGIADYATLPIVSNDCREGASIVDFCFDIAPAGPILSLKQTVLKFINPKPAGGAPQCASFGNDGDQPLVVTALAEIQPASLEYKIDSQPKVGETIPPLGAPNNPPNNPMTRQVCVTGASDGNPYNDDAQLVIHTNDATTLPTTVMLKSAVEMPSTFTVTCDGADPTVVAYAFQGAVAGTKHVCTLHNAGPSPWTWDQPQQIVATGASSQDDVNAAFSLTLQRNGTERGKAFFGTGSVAVVQAIDFTVTYAPLGTGKPVPQADLQIPFVQMPNPPTILTIPLF